MLEVRGAQVHVRVRGAGRPLLLLHGLGCSAEGWGPLEPHLPGFELIAVDPPGIGASPASWRNLTMAGLSRLLEEVLVALDRPRVDVLGLSWGGLLAQQFAHDHPDRVRRLVLCGTAFGLGSVPGDPRALMAMMTPLRNPGVARLVYGAAAMDSAGALERFLSLRGKPSLRGYYGQIGRLSGWSSLPWLGSLRAPTLVMAGRRDRVVPGANARLLAWRIPNARLHWIDEGHLFLMLRAAESGQVITRFLNGSE